MMSTVRRETLAEEVNARLGFVPCESVVLDCTGPAGRPDPLMVRLDLAVFGPDRPTRAVWDRLLGALRTAGPTAAWVLYYTTADLAELASVDRAVDALLAEVPVPRAGTVLVDSPTGGCTREQLGRIQPASAARRQAAASGIVAGAADLALYRRLVARAGRADLLDPVALGRVAVWLTGRDHRDRVLVLIAAVDPDDQEPDAPLSATVAAAAMAVLLDPTRARQPGPAVQAHVQVLTQLIAAVPVSYHAPARTLLALVAWWSGHGALADRHLSEALDADPDYRLAWLLTALLDAGTPPAWVPRPTAQH